MADEPAAARPAGIAGSSLKGPFPVGAYARMLRNELRRRARVQLFGEVWGLKVARAKVFFELRDADGAVPCSMWRNDFEALDLGPDVLADGAQVVAAGGPDYYPGSATSSPSFSFLVSDVRVAGEGDLLAQLDRLRKLLDSEGLFEPQRRLARPLLPRSIGVVTGESGKARDDVLAGLQRRGWRGRLVWAFAPVQDRHAAPRIARALGDLAAIGDVDVIVVARGGGSLADLFGFCDETLCRTVALLPVPVIASVGHHTDRTLIDDVAAVSCSTPTHAAEEAVRLDCNAARRDAGQAARRLQSHGRHAVVDRARSLQHLSRAPAEHVRRHRARLHQLQRELRAASWRQAAEDRAVTQRSLLVLRRSVDRLARQRTDLDARTGRVAADIHRAGQGAVERRARALESLQAALAAHDPDRALQRGFALVSDQAGALVTSAAMARRSDRLAVRFHDGHVRVRVEDPQP